MFLLRFGCNKFNCFPQLVSMKFKRDHSCKWFQSRVTCLVIKNSIFTFSNNFKSRTWFSIQNLKFYFLLIKFPAKHYFCSTWLINGNYSNLLHIEITFLAIKTKVNFCCSQKLYIRYFFERFKRWFVWTSTESVCPEQDAKVLIMSNEKWMTITCRISITNIVKFGQTASIKIDEVWSYAIDDADCFVNLRTIFNICLSE